jgi:osmotically-inducible protein OsmY
MKIEPMNRATLALTLTLLSAAGCEAATNAANGAGAFVEKTAVNIEQKTSDASITLAVKGSLVQSDDMLGRQVKVGTANGIVSLWGTVPNAESKARAEQLATQARGVVRVINAIEVGPLP